MPRGQQHLHTVQYSVLYCTELYCTVLNYIISPVYTALGKIFHEKNIFDKRKRKIFY